MKLKILKTILVYLGIIIMSYAFYLSHGFSEGLGFFGGSLVSSVVYLWIEYSDLKL